MRNSRRRETSSGKRNPKTGDIATIHWDVQKGKKNTAARILTCLISTIERVWIEASSVEWCMIFVSPRSMTIAMTILVQGP